MEGGTGSVWLYLNWVWAERLNDWTELIYILHTNGTWDLTL